jgi:hypothetical protein
VYESCSPISPNLLPTQMIQTEKALVVTKAGIIFKDSFNVCWTYKGVFESTYIPPTTVLPVTYSGNYFDGSPSTIYPTCEECQTIIQSDNTNYYYYGLKSCNSNIDTVIPGYSTTSDALSGVFIFDTNTCYYIVDTGASGTVPLGSNLDLLTPALSCFDSRCVASTIISTTKYICPQQPSDCFDTLAECEASGCDTCSEGLCNPS